MRIAKLLLWGMTLLPAAGWATDIPYDEAAELWVQTHGLPGYAEYLAEFIQFHNRNHLDERDDCYALLSGPIEVILVISMAGVVSGVATNTKGKGASCFRRTYEGLELKPPPHAPFAIRMTVGRGIRI